MIPTPSARAPNSFRRGNANAESPYTLKDNSPCRPSAYPCTQIGAWGVGCTDASAVRVTPPGATEPIRFAVAPNPFNPLVTIEFELSTPQSIRLEVVDLAGHHVATLTEGRFASGQHIASWGGRDDRGRGAPSGIYFLVLHGEAGTATRKVTLVR